MLPNREKNGNIIFAALGIQVKMALLGTSFVIKDENNVVVMHFNINEITSFDLIDNSVYIYSSDEIPFVITFSSNDEAEIAYIRIDRLINGENVV